MLPVDASDGSNVCALHQLYPQSRLAHRRWQIAERLDVHEMSAIRLSIHAYEDRAIVVVKFGEAGSMVIPSQA